MKKWKVRFEVAAQVFDDPLLDEKLDLRFAYDEARSSRLARRKASYYMLSSRSAAKTRTSFTSYRRERRSRRNGGLMRKPSLNLSGEEKAALRAMTDREMTEAAEDDPDAREMPPEVLAHRAVDVRLERSRAKRVAAARALVEQARAEAQALREREKTSG